MRLWLVALTAGFAAGWGCVNRPASGDAVVVAHVVLEPTVGGSCVVLAVRDPSGGVLAERRLERQAGKNDYWIAIYRGAYPERIALRAGALVGEGCANPLTQNAISDEATETFALGAVREVDLLIRMPSTAADADADGYVAQAHGGSDCDDYDPLKHPGATEGCSGGADLNCDGKSGCASPECEGKPCDDGRPCTGEAFCTSGVCTPRAPKPCPTPESICQGAGYCDGGACVYPPANEAAPCATDPCTSPNTCAAGLCVRNPVVCNAAPSECHDPGGTCVDGGCSYPARTPGSSCDAGACWAVACLPFRYPPRNVDISRIPVPSGVAVDLDCDVTYDSGADTFSNWSSGCGPRPVTHLVPQVTAGAPDVRVLAMNSLVVGDSSQFSLVGNRPVVFLVYGDATIRGEVLARGRSERPGAGARDATACAGSAGSDGSQAPSNGDSAGGGGGGGLGTGGAQGGRGSPFGAGGAAGDPALAPDTRLVPLVGGCPGGMGGPSVTRPSGAGLGGGGGGAVQISVAGVLTLDNALVSASGGGGKAADMRAGAGGGGSGGAVLLEADRLDFAGRSSGRTYVTANGGGGGEGGCYTIGTGSNGNDGRADSASPAQSVDTSCAGGAGGSGGSLNDAPGEGGIGLSGYQPNGGGGGGGAVGRIAVNARLRCTTAGNSPVFSPQPTSSGTDCP